MSSVVDPEGELDLYPDSSRAKLMRDQRQASKRARKQHLASLCLGVGVVFLVPGIWIDSPLSLKIALLGTSLLCIGGAAVLHRSRRRMLMS